MRIPLNNLLLLQIIYFFLGNMYNMGSLFAVRNGEPAWATTDALSGAASMSIYALCMSTGLLKNLKPYRVLMGVMVLSLGYGGVIIHLLNFGQMELYQSIYTWIGAICINCFGLALNLIAALGMFERGAKNS